MIMDRRTSTSSSFASSSSASSSASSSSASSSSSWSVDDKKERSRQNVQNSRQKADKARKDSIAAHEYLKNQKQQLQDQVSDARKKKDFMASVVSAHMKFDQKAANHPGMNQIKANCMDQVWKKYAPSQAWKNGPFSGILTLSF